MPNSSLMPAPKQQYFDINGAPLVGGKVYTYAAGTNTPKVTYTDYAGTIPQANPIILNVRGEASTAIFWNGSYKVEVRDAQDNLVYTVDNYNTDPFGFTSAVITLIADLASNIGASLIGFIQAGIGAVSRTVQDKLRDFFSTKDFGAIGDGVTNDTAALLNAKAVASAPYTNPGTYLANNATGLYGLWGPSSLSIAGKTLPLPGHPGRKDNFVYDIFERYARVQNTWSPLFIVGDSISEGSNSTSWKTDNYASIIRKAWQVRYQNANFGFANFDKAVMDAAPGVGKYAHDVTYSGFNNIYSFQDSYFGGVAVRSVTAGEYIEMTYTGKDAILVYERDIANGSTLEVKLDGAIIGSINTQAASTGFLSIILDRVCFSTQIVVPAYGVHTIRLTNTLNKPATVSGMVYVTDYSNISPVVFNMGRSSLALSDIPDDLLLLYARQSGKSVLALGVNDDILAKPIATFRSKLQTYFDGVVGVSGACVVADFIFSKPASNVYKTALREYAYVYGFPYLDFGRMWLSDTAQNQFLRYLDVDGVHPTDAGHEFIANEILRVIGLPYDKGAAVGYWPKDLVTIAPTGAWAALGAPYDGPKARRDQAGRVHLSGVFTGGTSVAYALIGTLPVGYRPDKYRIFTVSANHLFAEIEIHPDGQIVAGSNTVAALVSFDGISFAAA